MKLTKEDIDKVRHIEGFPIAKDEDIIALSNPPYYTACPNTFIEAFIKEHGKSYDEATDDYHREPFAADVSEGKNDPIYNAHSYHTKVPYKAIMRYILHYTDPGDLVFDGFCGTGMTGVAAQMCKNPDPEFKFKLEKEMPGIKWGARKAILNDLSPAATFIAYNYNTPIDSDEFEKEAKRILEECENECGWMYEIRHTTQDDKPSFQMALGEETQQVGKINYTVWSDVFICPNCSEEIILWDIAVEDSGNVLDKPRCQNCGVEINKASCNRADTIYQDKRTNIITSIAKQVPVKIFYSVGKKRYSKLVELSDLATFEKIESKEIPYWYPTDEMPKGYNTEQPKRSHGIACVHQFYTKRNLYVLAKIFDNISKVNNKRTRDILTFLFSSIYSRSHKLNRYMPNHNRHVGPLSGTLYMPFFQAEINILNLLRDKLSSVLSLRKIKETSIVSNQSTANLGNIQNDCVDYIFTDPPFGDNLNYSELNFIWESWLKVQTNNETEAVVNKVQNKGMLEYQEIIAKCFIEYFRILKPNRWITVEFHNSKNAVWNAIQQSLQRAGFIVADVRTLDKQKGTTKQLSYNSAVKQDLVISAYKPKESFKRKFMEQVGSVNTAWEFVRQHLEKLPVVVVKNGKIELIAERQAYLLFDRMVAYHIVNGITVPIDAADFYKGLDVKFLKLDGMYFLHDQINEYHTARITTEVEPVQMVLNVTDEKSAISWLYGQLNAPQTYADIQPMFMQEVRSIEKYEKLPELSVLLEDNFLQNDEGKWYIPDVTKAADVIKLREKRLLKEFEEYLNSTGKLNLFRTEAIRVGFAKLWKDKNCALIVKTSERLPDSVIQEDDKLLMYYDISLSRME